MALYEIGAEVILPSTYPPTIPSGAMKVLVAGRLGEFFDVKADGLRSLR